MVTFSKMLRRRDFAAIADWYWLRFCLIGLTGIVLAGIAAAAQADAPSGLRVAALSLLLGAAFTISAWLLGLLFGVPRALARPSGNGAAVPAAGSGGAMATPTPSGAALNASSRVNTNLEDVSDWLTKTIVGVGLTQLLAAPSFLWTAAEKINDFGIGWTKVGPVLALALFFYFAPGGFWLGYVATRTILTKLLDSIDSPPAESVEISSQAGLTLDISASKVMPASDGLAEADYTLRHTPLQALTTPMELAAWGSAQARNGDLPAAAVALEAANRSDPANATFRQQLATVYTALGRRSDAARLADEGSESEVDLLNALYEPRPQGYAKAIRIGERLAQRPGADKNAKLHLWLTCAFGQKYADEKDKSAAQSTLDELKQRVLREAQVAITADASSREQLRAAWKPAAGAEDNDLTGFPADDPELTALLG
ncbi:MAG: hypothetical protein AB7F22_23455 [Reyranella sp.]|uniref:hypothetical protein n=1 Tax=Reyranella sp. TaxID=1929291 RepID=UPI003D118216